MQTALILTFTETWLKRNDDNNILLIEDLT